MQYTTKRPKLINNYPHIDCDPSLGLGNRSTLEIHTIGTYCWVRNFTIKSNKLHASRILLFVWTKWLGTSPHYQSLFSDNSCYSIMAWIFGHHDYTCYTFKITTRCKDRKALISKVGVFDFILLIISIALIDMKYHFEPF